MYKIESNGSSEMVQYWMDSTEDRINELEEKSIENMQTKAQREQRKENNRTEYKRQVGHNQEV